MQLPPIRKDPFDRMLIVLAISAGIVLLTNDDMVRHYDFCPGMACAIAAFSGAGSMHRLKTRENSNSAFPENYKAPHEPR
ncbi:hypothetical protein [Caballeronia novacaledonica]|jgi:hypothetical protein|uniref:Uncharacterized protein n=1 Tax=Caballeronia novacaledonica TaxID=1544861 RepID=A0AA37I9X0_9BURK|nr:hypothetical protein [Caballeronia novacaledonica]GJH26005.1 hypothetical protein CBA19CS42_15835 [Caballeronia novacaledonica]